MGRKKSTHAVSALRFDTHAPCRIHHVRKVFIDGKYVCPLCYAKACELMGKK